MQIDNSIPNGEFPVHASFDIISSASDIISECIMIKVLTNLAPIMETFHY